MVRGIERRGTIVAADTVSVSRGLDGSNSVQWQSAGIHARHNCKMAAWTTQPPKAVFVINNTATVAGAFLASAASGTSGTLLGGRAISQTPVRSIPVIR